MEGESRSPLFNAMAKGALMSFGIMVALNTFGIPKPIGPGY